MAKSIRQNHIFLCLERKYTIFFSLPQKMCLKVDTAVSPIHAQEDVVDRGNIASGYNAVAILIAKHY